MMYTVELPLPCLVEEEECPPYCAPIALLNGVEKIWLLGSTRATSVHIFSDEAGSRTMHYFLLVLCSLEEQQIQGLQDRIENGLHQEAAITAIVLSRRQFDRWLKQGHRFACRVTAKAALVYDADPASYAQSCICEKDDPEENKRIHRLAMIKVHEFMTGADLYRIRGQYALSAFMLHQAAEQALRCILVLYTGFYVTTHNIERLLRYCVQLAPALAEIFPVHSERAQQKLHLLQRAYIGARYQEDYSITQHEINELMEKLNLIKDELEKGMGNRQ